MRAFLSSFLSRLVPKFFQLGILAIFVWSLLGLWRLALLCAFRGTLDASPSWVDWSAFFFRGAQFDARVAAFSIIPLLVLAAGFSILQAPFNAVYCRLQWITASLIFFFLHSLALANYCFFQEYHSQFNAWVWGLLYDDVGAIASTVWQTYPVIWILVSLGSLTLLSAYAWQKCFKRIEHFKVSSPKAALAFCLAYTLCFIVAVRGTLGGMPLNAQHVAVTGHNCLNAFVLNPPLALAFAIKDHLKGQSAQGLSVFWPSGDIQSAAACYLGKSVEPDFTLADLTQRTAQGRVASVKPLHIFWIVMESQDVWPLLQPYHELGLNPNLQALKLQGLSVEAFLSQGPGTMPSLNAIISGLADGDFNANYQLRSQQPYATALAPIFNALGYQSRFFYGGYLSWQDVGNFCTHQGFHHAIGGHAMGSLVGTDWGVEDALLFDYIASHISEDQPSFNLIMTSTNHPPYPLSEARLKALGWKAPALSPELASRYDGKIPLRIFAHTWYADRCVGDFVRAVEAQFPDSLFVITGDHNSRKFINEIPTFYERRAVPLILYGPQVLAGKTLPAQVAGDHLDIAPTLVELVAPAGFIYHSFGHNLLDSNAAAVGCGSNFIITPSEIVDASTGNAQLLPWVDSPNPSFNVPQAIQRYNALRALAWWAIFAGN